MRVTALCGGVGGAKLVLGLYSVLPHDCLTVIGNTGDDITMFGLHVSPDLDIVMYTLAGIVDETKGWGLRDDSFRFLDAIHQMYGQSRWFNIGDRDLATHVRRTELMRLGLSLSEATRELCQALNVDIRLIPMSDDPLQTYVRIGDGTLINFEEYFVLRQCKDPVTGVEYVGADTARPAPGVLDALKNTDMIVICPSNPVASIGPILSVRGIREALRSADCPVVAVSPLIGGKAVKGPTEKFMAGLNMEVSAVGVARYYQDIVTHYIMDRTDRDLLHRVESLGMTVHLTDTLMTSTEDKIRLARTVLSSQ